MPTVARDVVLFVVQCAIPPCISMLLFGALAVARSTAGVDQQAAGEPALPDTWATERRDYRMES